MNKLQFRIGLAFCHTTILLSVVTGAILLIRVSAIWCIASITFSISALAFYRVWLNPVFKRAWERYDTADNDVITFIETEIKEGKKDKDSLINFVRTHTLEHYINEEFKTK